MDERKNTYHEDTEEDLRGREEQANTERLRLEAFAINLLKKRAEAVEYRTSSGIERTWREDEIIFDALSSSGPNEMLDYATGEAQRPVPNREPRRSKVCIGIIRGRCETAEGRFYDIQLPVDDRNWGLKVTPVPEMADQLKDNRPAMQNGQQITDQDGKQSTMADIANDQKDRAKKAMKLMETEIDDQLTECGFNGECRKVIRSAVRNGTGILKGPNVVKSVSSKWQPQTNPETGTTAHVLKSLQDLQPGSVSVDPWNVYPSPGTKEDIEKTAEYIWEKDEILPRDVRNLVDVDGYDEEQLKLVLQEDPKRVRAATDQKHRGYTTGIDTVRRGKSYEKWEYHGDVNKDDLQAMGCDCEHVIHKSISACVVFINDRPVKVELNTLDTGHLPYDFFQWTVISSDEPWGIGIPRMMMWLQRIITAAWRSMMDNAGDSSGQMVVMKQGVEAYDGIVEIGGKKIFIDTTEDIDDVRKVFAQFQLASNQEDLQAIIELALRFVDLETSMPAIFQGETQEIPETLGVTKIMVDSSNVGVRQRVKLYDDRITKPHITRYYHYNMQYSKKDQIKGDFNVDARGVSVLLEKDHQAQTLLQVFSLKGDPDINRITDWEKAAKQFYASRRLDILKSDEEIDQIKEQQKQNPPQPPAPQVETAKIRTEGDMKKETLRQKSDMAELQFKAEQAALDRDHQKAIKKMELDIKLMEFSEKRNIEISKLKAQLALGSAGMNLQKDLADEKSSVPEVATPPTEPAGRAPVGQAYQR